MAIFDIIRFFKPENRTSRPSTATPVSPVSENELYLADLANKMHDRGAQIDLTTTQERINTRNLSVLAAAVNRRSPPGKATLSEEELQKLHAPRAPLSGIPDPNCDAERVLRTVYVIEENGGTVDFKLNPQK